MAIFAVHGALRNPVIKIAIIYDNALWHLFAGLVFLTIVWLAAIAAKRLYELMLRPIERIHISECRTSRILGITVQSGLVAFLIFVLGFYTYTSIYARQKDQIQFGEPTLSAKIGQNDTYSRILDFTIDKEYSNLQLDCNMEYKATDNSTETIPIVIEIKDVLWQKIDIPAEYAKADFKKFNLRYNYVKPFNKKLKGSTLKVYFWNHKSVSGEFKNLEASICH